MWIIRVRIIKLRRKNGINIKWSKLKIKINWRNEFWNPRKVGLVWKIEKKIGRIRIEKPIIIERKN